MTTASSASARRSTWRADRGAGRAQVEDVIADCARAGVHGAVVISAGFAEFSADGAATERRLRERARAAGHASRRPELSRRREHRSGRAPQRQLRATRSRPRATSRSCRRAARSASRCSRWGKATVSACRASSRSATAPTSRATTCSRTAAEDPRTAVVVALPRELRQSAYVRVARAGGGAGESRSSRSSPVARRRASVRPRATRRPSPRVDVAVDALFEQAGVIRTDTLEGLFDVAALPCHAAAAGGAAGRCGDERGRPRHPVRRRVRSAGPRGFPSSRRPRGRVWPPSLPPHAGLEQSRRRDRLRDARAVCTRGGDRWQRFRRRCRGRDLHSAALDARGRGGGGDRARCRYRARSQTRLSVFMSRDGAPPRSAPGSAVGFRPTCFPRTRPTRSPPPSGMGAGSDVRPALLTC